MRGFTLMELMVVISIIAIISVFAALNATSFIRDSRVTESRDLLLSDLEEIKLKSLAGAPHAVIVVGGSGTSYLVSRLTDSNNDFARNAGETWTTLRTQTLPLNVKAALNGGDELWFDRKGIPRTAAWATMGRTFTLWFDANGNNTADAGEPVRKITLSAGGRIQYEK